MTPAPWFSAWSPAIAAIGALVAGFAPGWVTALVWALGVLCALPFPRLRPVVPMALVTWTAGWLAAFLVTVAESGIVGLFVVK
jgi:hypothetical protein